MLTHALQWLRTGRTVTPIEPSESMSTLSTGRINAGFIFFGAAILFTLVLGRWVCGWGCHLVAYQDLTNWLLKKLRLRPKAFRSRLLIFVPLAAAFYMFIWPSAYRAIAGAPSLKLSTHLTTTGFWDTFPQYGIAALTVLVCGVAIIYLLGPKGFCTFACPYGAFFGLADKLALWRIRVTDACRQCGHCTAVCTSNVKVAEEVHLYKMVVDPGCMKCLDCVSVCPSDALYYGFGLPALRAKPAAPRPAIRYDLSFAEELAAALIFVAAFFCYRGLYDKIPFLLSLGIAGVVSYLVIKAARVFYARDVLIQRTRLKAAGIVRPLGFAYLVVVAALIGLTAHSGLWRYHDYLGNLAFENSPPETFGWQYEPNRAASLTVEQSAAIRTGLDHLTKCQALGFISVPENDREMAWLCLHSPRPDDAVAALHRVLQSEPGDMHVWAHLAKVQTSRGNLSEARKFIYTRSPSKSVAEDGPEAWCRRCDARSADLYAVGTFLAHCGESDAAGKASMGRQLRSILGHSLLASDSSSGMNQIDAARPSLIHAVTLSRHPRIAQGASRSLQGGAVIPRRGRAIRHGHPRSARRTALPI
jgi:polyferredoxin